MYIFTSTLTTFSCTSSACSTARYEWLLHNCLTLNPDKSESALFRTASRNRSIHDVVLVNVTGTAISLLHSIKNRGLTLDENLKFNKHVNAICKGCFFYIRALSHIRPSMSANTVKMVVCAVVSYRLVYCNSVTVLVGM